MSDKFKAPAFAYPPHFPFRPDFPAPHRPEPGCEKGHEPEPGCGHPSGGGSPASGGGSSSGGTTPPIVTPPPAEPVSYHDHATTWRWTGSTSGGDWYDASNWTDYDSTGNTIGNGIPQSDQNADVNVGYVGNTTPVVLVANAASYNQLRSLSVWQDSTLKITATYGDGDTDGYVFATAGFENDGTIIVDTAAKVELGGVTENRDDGTITIIGNDGNVVFDGDHVNSGGTINLIDSALGSAANPVTVSGGTVTLQQGSTFYTSGGLAAAVTVDPATTNTIYLVDASGASVTSDTAINGVSQNTRFGVSGDSAPVAACYSHNRDGCSYTLTITLADGQKVVYSDIEAAQGYKPSQHVSIVADGTGGWLIEDSSDHCAPASYDGNALHQSLAGVASAAQAAGGDTSQYSSTPVSWHDHPTTWRWTGDASGGDWYDASNWTDYDSTGNAIGNGIPQSDQNADVNVGYVGSTTPITITADAASYNQIRSLSVWQDATLKITATYGDGDTDGYVFATAGFENDGTIVIDTGASNHPARDAGVFRRRWYCGPAGGLSSARAGVHGGVDWGCH